MGLLCPPLIARVNYGITPVPHIVNQPLKQLLYGSIGGH